MPRTQQEINAAAERLQERLDRIDAGEEDVEFTPTPLALRALGETVIAHADAGRAVDEAVQSAREAGHSWGEIALILGVHRQTAYDRYATKVS